MDTDRQDDAHRRDREASERDLRAVVRDRAADPDMSGGERQAREEAAADRRAAAADRRAAAQDRAAASGEAEPESPRPQLRLVSDDPPER